ncbi:MAG: hypothetical protein N2109_13465 [Fimbriimonadales bacterium]|nr:hypothetical protein [Fimbriimonadales bacterium]
MPALMLLASYGGDWSRYLEALYSQFCQDWIHAPPAPFDGKRVALKRRPAIKGKEATFWHFITEGPTESARVPDLRRCERIPWPRPIVDAVDDGRLRCWKTTRKNEERYVLALEDFSYVVVIADRGEYVLPWTAYPVDRAHQRRKLAREYEAARSQNGWCRP